MERERGVEEERSRVAVRRNKKQEHVFFLPLIVGWVSAIIGF